MEIFILFALIAIIVAVIANDKFRESSANLKKKRYDDQRIQTLDERSDQEYYNNQPYREADAYLALKFKEEQLKALQRENRNKELQAEREHEIKVLTLQIARERQQSDLQLEKYKADKKYEHKSRKIDVKRYKIDAKVAIKGLESINFRIAQYATIATTKSDFYEKAILGRLETLKTNAEIDLNRLKTLDSMEAEKRKNRILNDIDNNLNSIHNDLNDAW